MLNSTVFNTSEICASHGVQHAVFSPGSRNAPLTISFARNQNITKWVVPDERSAGFIALGIAQKVGQPVALSCTSGTALLNYAPAIAEAYYRQIPLVVLSADRPPELIDQRDGQTIRQFEVLRNHVRLSLQLPVVKTKDDEEEFIQRLKLGLQTSLEGARGPVHLNIPFEEPFYPLPDQVLSFSTVPRWSQSSVSFDSVQYPDKEVFKNKKVLIVIGQSNLDENLNESIKHVNTQLPVLKSPLSNVHVRGIEQIDLFLDDQPELKPDILITAGLSVLSKKLKTFLRRNGPDRHFHFDPAGIEVDTYGTKPELIQSPLSLFLQQLDLNSMPTDYHDIWQSFSSSAKQHSEEFLSTASFSETIALHEVLKVVPEGVDLHLGNSMPVRFLELFGSKQKINTWCNRGTSGIDGCTSTAMGTSLVSDKLNILLVGDLSFLYDRNAFFHNYSYTNLRIVVLNNYGGGIFRLIEGPKHLPELEEYFETRHNRTAEYICQENNIEYYQVADLAALKEELGVFFDASDNCKLLEILTDPKTNETVFDALKQYIHEQING